MEHTRLKDDRIAVIGLGLMGRSIVACLLASGHRVSGVDRDISKRRGTRDEVRHLLEQMKAEGLLQEDPVEIVKRFDVLNECGDLTGCEVVIESIVEDWDAKKDALQRIEASVSNDAIIGSNTSAIPISRLQTCLRHPERLLGMHWAEPAHITRFMEIICGEQTAPAFAERAVALARRWGKEPTLVRKDIRGFITNRIMYAMIREAFFLVENGYATPADVDRSVRNDLGWWITFAGPFRYMDLTGIPAYAAVMKDLLPELDCSKEVPALMKKVVESGWRGVQNASGFYAYTKESAERWEKLFLKFSYEIRALALKYPEDVGDRPVLSGEEDPSPVHPVQDEPLDREHDKSMDDG
jgi:3-hydroxybutyryl-CoA dehydrogenase